jgi:hypothetical protein
MNNLEIYENVRNVPESAKKKITGGRLNGKTDINPMWRIKSLTELFGMVGIGWYYEITRQWLEPGANGEVSAFVNINLYVRPERHGQWSKPIAGTGGNTFVAKEAKGLYTDDECYKKALTDAISVACKAIGIGADVYWQDDTKYTKGTVPEQYTVVDQYKELKRKIQLCNTVDELEMLYHLQDYETQQSVEAKKLFTVRKNSIIYGK